MVKIRRFYKPNRIILKTGKGYAHREHRSKKGKQKISRDFVALEYKKKKEKLKHEDKTRSYN